MSDVKVGGYGDMVVDAMYVVSSKINAYGVNYKDLVWFDIPDEENPGTKLYYGWYQWDGENDPIDCNEDPLSAGEGLKIQAEQDAAGWDFVSAGEVAKDGVAVTLVKGSQYLACAYPGASSFGDVHIEGYGDMVIDAMYVTASKLNEYGVNYKDLVWFDIPDEENPGTKIYYGWYQWDGENDPIDCNEDELAAGDTLKVQAEQDAAGWTITFPAAISTEK